MRKSSNISFFSPLKPPRRFWPAFYYFKLLYFPSSLLLARLFPSDQPNINATTDGLSLFAILVLKHAVRMYRNFRDCGWTTSPACYLFTTSFLFFDNGPRSIVTTVPRWLYIFFSFNFRYFLCFIQYKNAINTLYGSLCKQWWWLCSFTIIFVIASHNSYRGKIL